MRVSIADPPAYTPPYDRALCAALARAGADVELATSRFVYGEVAPARGYRVSERFYTRAVGGPASRLRRVSKLVSHVPDMLAYRRAAARSADLVHFQWLTAPWLDGVLLPDRPRVLTAHDLLPREPRPGQARAQRRLFDRMDALVVHSEYGRRALSEGFGVAAEKINVIPHGAFDELAAARPSGVALPAELAAVEGPVVLFFGLLRPYKGLETLLEAWRGVTGAELWIVGRPRMDLAPLRARAGLGVRFVPRFVGDAELAVFFRRADVVVLPYAPTERLDFSGVLATALAFGRATVVSDVGGFAEVAAHGAARLVAPGDVEALRGALVELLADPDARSALEAAALAAGRGPYSWDAAARATLALYERLL
ncbi:MAG: glycosyltransferase family 4 protein [Solirubrobacteraceae bacterium]